jgi:hypothetical protein
LPTARTTRRRQIVAVSAHPHERKSSKHQSPWEGPYRVVKRMNGAVYRIQPYRIVKRMNPTEPYRGWLWCIWAGWHAVNPTEHYCGWLWYIWADWHAVNPTEPYREWLWYIWADWQAVREQLGTSGLEEGVTGVVGEESPWEPNHVEGRLDQSQMSQTQALGNKKWRYAYRLFGYTNSLKEGTVWHIYPVPRQPPLRRKLYDQHLLSNNYKQRLLQQSRSQQWQKRGTVFSAFSEWRNKNERCFLAIRAEKLY